MCSLITFGNLFRKPGSLQPMILVLVGWVGELGLMDVFIEDSAFVFLMFVFNGMCLFFFFSFFYFNKKES